MPRPILPRHVAPPSSRFAHGIVHSGRSRRLVIAGQVGMRVDGSVPADLDGQLDCIWDNIAAILTEAGMGLTDLVRITAYSTVQGGVGAYRAARDRRLGGHLVAATYVEVTGLADPRFLVEIEGEAICEEPDLAFLELPQEDANLQDDLPEIARAQVSGT